MSETLAITGPIYLVIALGFLKYGYDAFCAAALLVATILSFVSISVILWLLGPVLDWTVPR